MHFMLIHRGGRRNVERELEDGVICMGERDKNMAIQEATDDVPSE